MAVLVVVAYAVVAVTELLLWPQRPLSKVLVYLLFLAGAAVLSVLITLNFDLAVPSPLDALDTLFKKVWGGGGTP